MKSDETGICVHPHVSTHFLADVFPPFSYSLQATFHLLRVHLHKILSA